MATWTRDPMCLAVTTLAVARVTRLVTRDDMPALERARDAAECWIERRAPGYGEVVHCPWCASFWIAAAATLAAEACDRAGRRRGWLLACAPWAISAVVGLLAEREVA